MPETTDDLPVSKAGLKRANTVLAGFEDAYRADGVEVPAWVIAARYAVRTELRRCNDGER